MNIRSTRRGSNMMEDINILDNLGRDTLVEEPLSEFVIMEDTFSKDSEQETDHVR
jgi:hypothetical protein